jgi:hypothetical protein
LISCGLPWLGARRSQTRGLPVAIWLCSPRYPKTIPDAMEEFSFCLVLPSKYGPNSAVTYDSFARISWNHKRRSTQIRHFQRFTLSVRNKFAKI